MIGVKWMRSKTGGYVGREEEEAGVLEDCKSAWDELSGGGVGDFG